MRKAQNGDTVKVHFTGKLEDGTEFASTLKDEPLEFTIGEGKLIPGFEQGAIGMGKGDQKTIRVEADQAFGNKRADLVSQIPKSVIPGHIELSVGLELQITSPSGDPIEVVVTDISAEEVTIDANPPLAGHPLTFDMELIEFV